MMNYRLNWNKDQSDPEDGRNAGFLSLYSDKTNNSVLEIQSFNWK